MSQEEGTHGPDKWQKTPGAGSRKNYKGLERESEMKMIRVVREREAAGPMQMAWLWNLWKVRERSDVTEGAEKGAGQRERKGTSSWRRGFGKGCCEVGSGVRDSVSAQQSRAGRNDGARRAKGGTVISLFNSNL